MSITSSNTNRNCTKLRIVFLGDQGVGKSSVIDRYTTNRFDQTHTPTVGIDFNVRDLTRNGHVYRLQMWDTAGQQRYRSLIPTYLRNAHAVVFVYDVSKPSTLENIKNWQKLFVEHQQAPGILVANKTDLSNARKITKQEGQKMAAELQLKYYEVSAKTGKKIYELFDDILDMILTERRKEDDGVETSRQKMKELRTIDEQGGEEEPKTHDTLSVVTLRKKIMNNLNCCS